jgi:hypothetical protein
MGGALLKKNKLIPDHYNANMPPLPCRFPNFWSSFFGLFWGCLLISYKGTKFLLLLKGQIACALPLQYTSRLKGEQKGFGKQHTASPEKETRLRRRLNYAT